MCGISVIILVLTAETAVMFAYRNEPSNSYRCWDCVLWLDLWKRSILYSSIAVVLFLLPYSLWLAYVSGAYPDKVILFKYLKTNSNVLRFTKLNTIRVLSSKVSEFNNSIF